MELDETFLPKEIKLPVFDESYVQLAGFQDCSYVAGPGRRCVVWVSGCHRRCPGCFQPHFFGFNKGQSTSVNALADRILELKEIDGVTFSGGEPFEQSPALTKVCRIIKEHKPELSTLAYSGYRVEVLGDSESFGQLLELLDILIDGEYRAELAGPYLWRGSSNQRVIYRDKIKKEWVVDADQKVKSTQDVQISLLDSDLLISGFPDEAFQKEFVQRLQSRGIVLERKVQ